MKYKTIEGMRQTRLMITEVLVPAVTLSVTVYHIPAVKKEVDQKIEDLINKRKAKKLMKKL